MTRQKDSSFILPPSSFSVTESLCPVCLEKIPATLVTDGPDVYLDKHCGAHGSFHTIIWRGNPRFDTWVRPKHPVRPPVCDTEIAKGCPFDCGLCLAHRQITCTALLEVTHRCNLTCHYCFASAGNGAETDPDLETIHTWFQSLVHAAPTCNVQLSGGEPTVRDDLPQIIQMGRGLQFAFIQLNTNGLRLARETGYAGSLKRAGLSSVFLQFDGVTDAVYQRLRGQTLLAEKHLAISRCRDAGLGVVLVPMIVPRINDHELGDILEFAISQLPTVRGIHIQPVSYFGRCPTMPQNRDRITLPEIMTALEQQGRAGVRVSDFRPPGCEHARCSFHANYIVFPDGRLMPLISPEAASCCRPAEAADVGARRTIAAVARHWCSAGDASGGNETPSVNRSEPMDLDSFLDMARTRTFSISAMAFQDVWNLDMERLKDCCIHVVAPDGRLIPFCACNLTDAQNIPLYRHAFQSASRSASC